MANDAKRTSQLGITTTLSNSDRVVVLTNPNTAAQTQTITVTNFANRIVNAVNTYSTNLIPASDNTYTLGNSSYQWKSLYVSANTIFIGGIPLSISNTGTLLVNNSPFTVDTGNVVFTQYNAPWNQTYPVITTKVQYDLNILGNNAPVNISSDQYVQLVYSEDRSPYGGGNNQSYYWTNREYNGQYVQTSNSAVNSYAWTEKDYWANGTIDTYGVFSNNDYNFNYSYSFSPSYKTHGYGLDIKPFGGFNNTLTLEPTADYDIHLYESYTNGAITLGKYGQTNFRVYGPGGANNGGGQYGNDIRADLVGNSIFNITTNNGGYTWTLDATGKTSAPGAISFGHNVYHQPDLTNRSGEKLTLWDQSDSNNYSYSIGIEQDTMWYGVDVGNPDKGFRWYSGNTPLLDLTRTGKIIVTNDIVPISDNTYSLGNTTNQWKSLHVSGNTIFIDRVPLSSSNGSIAANTIKVNTIYDELRRPVYNVNALDINADGGIAAAVFSLSDPMFDGGSTITVYNQFEASLDGGASFNNRHSASYIDGGGANII
jgi:hypothetical protein